MTLGGEDQRRLAAIEQQLLIDDPHLARRLAGYPAASSSVSCRSAVVVLGVLCTFAVVASLAPTAVLLGGLLPVGVVVSPWVVRGMRREPPVQWHSPTASRAVSHRPRAGWRAAR